MRGFHLDSLTCTVAPLTRAVSLLAIALAITVPSIALARESRTHTPVHQCGVVQQTVGVVEQGGVPCNQARAVARQWLAGHNHPDGFACKRKKTDAGSGFQGVCTNQTKRVTIIPQ
ncbi:MAG: hypothetical protein WAL22_11865 [Solirubrobacteraceae bacterium]|jgi:hypothetical protein